MLNAASRELYVVMIAEQESVDEVDATGPILTSSHHRLELTISTFNAEGLSGRLESNRVRIGTYRHTYMDGQKNPL